MEGFCSRNVRREAPDDASRLGLIIPVGVLYTIERKTMKIYLFFNSSLESENVVDDWSSKVPTCIILQLKLLYIF